MECLLRQGELSLDALRLQGETRQQHIVSPAIQSFQIFEDLCALMNKEIYASAVSYVSWVCLEVLKQFSYPHSKQSSWN